MWESASATTAICLAPTFSTAHDVDMRCVFAALLLAVIPLAAQVVPEGCAAFADVQTLRDNAKISVPAGQAVLVFFGQNDALFRSTISVDGSLQGITGRHDYAVVQVAPGDHRVCIVSIGEGSSHHPRPAIVTIRAEPDHVYYFQQTRGIYINSDGMSVEQMTDETLIGFVLKKSHRVKLPIHTETIRSSGR